MTIELLGFNVAIYHLHLTLSSMIGRGLVTGVFLGVSDFDVLYYSSIRFPQACFCLGIKTSEGDRG